MVSRVTRELSVLIFRHQLIPVDINVDPVHQGTLEMELSVLVGWLVDFSIKFKSGRPLGVLFDRMFLNPLTSMSDQDKILITVPIQYRADK